MNQLKLFSIMIFLISLSACSGTIRAKGTYFEQEGLNSLRAGITTKEQVFAALGTPTFVSDFPPETWYYVYEKTENIAFFQPKIIEEKTLSLQFDQQGRLVNYKKDDFAKNRDMKYVEDYTVTKGDDNSPSKEMIGNIGKFNKSKKIKPKEEE